MIRNTTINTSVSTGCVAMQDPLHEQGIWWVELHRMVVTHKSPAWTLMLQPAGAWAPCWSNRCENGSLFLDSCSHNNEAGDQPRHSERQSSPRQCHFSLLRNGRGSDVATLPHARGLGMDDVMHSSYFSARLSAASWSYPRQRYRAFVR